jgi:hypothetical protein
MNVDDVKEVEIPTRVKSRWFKDVKDFQTLKRLRLTRYSMYATSLPDHTEFLLDVLALYFSDLKQLIITDATACIGGNARMFIGKFRYVNIVDISKLHIDILKHNFKVLGLNSNVGDFRIYNKNYLSIGASLKQDIIFLDVPWGGVDYRLHSNKELFLFDSNKEPVGLSDLINKKLYLHAKMIVVKVPNTYDISVFRKMGIFKSVNTINVMSRPNKIIYSMVILSHIDPKKNVPKNRILSSVNYRSVMEMIKKNAGKK